MNPTKYTNWQKLPSGGIWRKDLSSMRFITIVGQGWFDLPFLFYYCVLQYQKLLCYQDSNQHALAVHNEHLLPVLFPGECPLFGSSALFDTKSMVYYVVLLLPID